MSTNNTFDVKMLSVSGDVATIGNNPELSGYYSVRGQVKAAMNSFAALVTGYYKHHEHGLHVKFDRNNPPSSMRRAGYVSHEYAGDLVDVPAEKGWYPIYIEAWQIMVGRKLNLVRFEQDEPRWVTADRQTIRKMDAMDKLCDGWQLTLYGRCLSKADEDEKRVEDAQHYFQFFKDTLALPTAEATKIIREHIVNHQAYLVGGKLGAHPEMAAAIAKDVESLPLYGQDGVIPVEDLMGKIVRGMNGDLAIGAPHRVTEENVTWVVAYLKRNRLAVAVIA